MNTGLFFIGIALTAVCFILSKFFLEAGDRHQDERAFWLKGATGLCFVALGFLTFTGSENQDITGMMFLGLCFGLIGDQFLALRFVYPNSYNTMFLIGTGAFAVGHILYITALLRAAEGSVLTAVCFALVLSAISAFVLLRHKFSPGGALTAAGFVYIALVSSMGACACAALVRTGRFAFVLFALAGLLFITSDLILCIQNYGDTRHSWDDAAVHTTYYAAQCLIAWSLLFL